jgi:hypothetical protein
MFFTGWFWVTIAAPMALPVFAILILLILPIPEPLSDDLKVMAPVKDGQLCWSAIAMGASMFYEMWEAFETHKTIPVWSGPAIGAVGIVMLAAMLIASLGPVYSTPIRTSSAGGIKAWIMHYTVFVSSAIMTICAALLYTAMHFSIQQTSSG